jgi:hypothetical protein
LIEYEEKSKIYFAVARKQLTMRWASERDGEKITEKGLKEMMVRKR